MDTLLAFAIGGLYAAATYLLLQRSLGQLILGLALLTNATNLLIFTAAGLTRDRPPLVPEGMTEPEGAVADPLAQAFILTAIVIGFGLLAFFLALAFRTYQALGSDDLDSMQTTDQLTPPADAGPQIETEAMHSDDAPNSVPEPGVSG